MKIVTKRNGRNGFILGNYYFALISSICGCSTRINKASEELDNVVTNIRLLYDIKKLYQISSLEACYSVVNHFAAKG